MISIITPTYNSEQYLEKCIQSIVSQDYKEYEHIIIDGGSTDHTIDIIKSFEGKYNMRWISEKDDGMYDAISKGFRIAQGDIFCWLNSDDVYMPWTLQVVARVFSDTKVNWITGIPMQMTEEGVAYCPVMKPVVHPQKLIRKGWMDGRRLGCIQQESTFWRRSLYEITGGLDPRYKLAGDYDLWRRFAEHEKLCSVNSILAAFRVHVGQKSENRQAYFGEMDCLSHGERLCIKLKLYKMIYYIIKIFQYTICAK